MLVDVLCNMLYEEKAPYRFLSRVCYFTGMAFDRKALREENNYVNLGSELATSMEMR